MKIKKSTLLLWKKRFFFSLLIVAIFSLLYSYFVTSFFTITQYKIIGVPAQYEESLVSQINSNLSQKIFGFIPKDKIFSYHSNAIRHAVVTILPNTKTVETMPFGLHTVKIIVTKYIPVFKIDNYKGITEDGIIYQDYDNINTLPTLTFSTSSFLSLDKELLFSSSLKKIESKDFSTIVPLLGKVNAVIFKVSRVDISEDRDITFYSENGLSKVIFSGLTDSDKVWSNLVSAIDTDPLKSQLLQKKEELEYLDTRFGNKVFFKFTNSKKTDIIENNATSTATTTVLQ